MADTPPKIPGYGSLSKRNNTHTLDNEFMHTQVI
jgi:hypothetical protein